MATSDKNALPSLVRAKDCRSDWLTSTTQPTPNPVRRQETKVVAVNGGNAFAELMETVKVASLGQITDALFEVGGQYRRSM